MSAGEETPVFSSLSTDPDMLELIQEFVGVLPQRVQAIEDAVMADDLDALQRLAHQLRGASGGYGYATIGQAAANLESSAKLTESVSQLTSEIQELVSLCHRAKATPT